MNWKVRIYINPDFFVFFLVRDYGFSRIMLIFAQGNKETL